MPRPGPILKLKRYTQLPQLLHLLNTRKLTTLSPSTWQDQNDTTYLTRYMEACQIKGLYVLCMTEAADTFHHWNVYANGPSGVKLEFDPGRFKYWLHKVRNNDFRLERVQYKRLDEIEEAARETRMLPFLKRKAFRDENEVRLLIEDTESHGVVLLLKDFDLSAIRKISLSPWLPLALVDTVISTLHHAFTGTESQWTDIVVRRTSLLFNEAFSSAGQ
jgi:hypothetical protein